MNREQVEALTAIPILLAAAIWDRLTCRRRCRDQRKLAFYAKRYYPDGSEAP